MAIIDVTVPIDTSIPIFPGDPGVDIQSWKSIEDGDVANVTLLHFGAHTGTHVDAPAHFLIGGSPVRAMPLDVLIGPARVVAIPSECQSVTHEMIEEMDLLGVERLLFKTRNSEFWSDTTTGFRTDFTFIEGEAARLLVELGIRLVGFDSLSVEKYSSESHETHYTLLGAGAIIIEGLDLRAVAAGDYELICLPLKVAAGHGDGAPARVVLRTIEPS
jgi:arylformamidase